MFLAKVLTGDYCQGYSGLKAPPVKPQAGDGNRLYDSVVDRMVKPTLFVVFKDSSVYPTYLITYWWLFFVSSHYSLSCHCFASNHSCVDSVTALLKPCFSSKFVLTALLAAAGVLWYNNPLRCFLAPNILWEEKNEIRFIVNLWNMAVFNTVFLKFLKYWFWCFITLISLPDAPFAFG